MLKTAAVRRKRIKRIRGSVEGEFVHNDKDESYRIRMESSGSNGVTPGQGPLLPTAPVNARDGSAIPEELLVGDSSGSLKCEYCPYRVSKKDRMRRHVNTVHYKERPFRCHLCDSTFGRKDKIKRHLETVHSAERPYKCEFCAHTSGRKDKIKEHVQSVHFKSRPPKSHKKKASQQEAQQGSPVVSIHQSLQPQASAALPHSLPSSIQLPTQVTVPQTTTLAPQYVQAILQTQNPLIPQTSIITKPEYA
ncbi:Uncharacterized protein FKW44_017102 [Caligus rogercresseyi]|uniref:C2H2-type domain-containing protein n=1 Tax=Caligus rogercresseyi TaxID=217165 RepID=A0A7T8H2Q4_CALRO|nr:Uncharacterized protein FKW44_017102 [Caligus rogercresseyi]